MPIAQLKSSQIAYLEHPFPRLDEADALPILLLHGFSSSIRDNWLDTGWVEFLADLDIQIIAMDNRGHGDSEKFYLRQDYSLQQMANDAVELLNFLNIPKAHVMGYSMGARIAALMTMNHSERVGKLILGGNGYGMIEGTGDWTPVHEGLLANSIDDVVDLRARAFRRFAERTNSDRKALAACVQGLRKTFEESDFRAIENKVLVAIGTKDDIAGSGEKLVQLMKNARYFPIEGRDHMRASTDRLFKQAVAEFLV